MLFIDRMKGLNFKLTILILLFFISNYFSESEIKPTHKYEDCKFHALKSKGKLDCVVEEFSGNEMYLLSTN